MPITTLQRPCVQPRCSELVRQPHNRCERHRRAQGAISSPDAIEREVYWTRRWRKVRAVFLRANPLCIDCLAETPPRTTAATDCDHVVPIREGGAIWDEDNFAARCKSHHAMKTRRETNGRP